MYRLDYLMYLLDIPFHAAIIGLLWTHVLTESGNIFGWWPQVANKISNHKAWIKIAYGCEKCIAGQIALWWTVYRCIPEYDIASLHFVFWQTLYAIGLAWIFSIIINRFA